MEYIFKVITMIKLFYYRTLDFLAGKTNKRKEDAEIGELVVTGKGETEIPLESLPRLVEMKFKDCQDPVPCNPHHDKFHHEIHRKDHKYFMIIKWNVSSVREIVWAIYF
jgi:hypothetical protein